MESSGGGKPHEPGADPGPDGLEQSFFHEVHVIRGAILLLAVTAGAALLHYASSILIPVVLAVFLAYVLNPFVRALMRLRLPQTEIYMPRGLAALLIVVVAVGLTVSLGVLIGNQLGSFVSDIARYEDRIAENVEDMQERLLDLQERFEGRLQPIRRAQEDAGLSMSARQGENQAGQRRAEADPKQVLPTLPEQHKSLLEQTSDLWMSATSYIAGGLTGLIGFLAQSLTCIFVLFFMLVEAPKIRDKLIHIMGTTERRREMVLEVLENVNRDVQRYLFNRFATNVVLGSVAMLAYWIYGLNYVLLLGILAGLFNFVPYVGPVVGAIFPALVAYLQFGTFESVLWVVLIYGLLTGIEGNIITPLVLGRHLELNSLAVMLGLVFWGWLWGAIGLLLAIPILAAIKAVAVHVEDMHPIAELLRA
ncbi:MAG: AI-2E family transporter [Persicimonas sp.]